MFSYTLLKAHLQAGLLVDWVSGTNKQDGSPESTDDKGSEAGRGCRQVKAEMKERQLSWARLGLYRAAWVLCQTGTIISVSHCVETSKLTLLTLFSLSSFTKACPSGFFFFLVSSKHKQRLFNSRRLTRYICAS